MFKIPKREQYVTIQEVEAAFPCISGYFDALRALKCLPDPKGDFAGYNRAYNSFSHACKKPLPFTKSTYSPKARVPLAVVGAASSEFLEWVLCNVARLESLLSEEASRLVDENEEKRAELEEQIRELEAKSATIGYLDHFDVRGELLTQIEQQFPEKKRRGTRR